MAIECFDIDFLNSGAVLSTMQLVSVVELFLKLYLLETSDDLYLPTPKFESLFNSTALADCDSHYHPLRYLLGCCLGKICSLEPRLVNSLHQKLYCLTLGREASSLDFYLLELLIIFIKHLLNFCSF